MSAQSSELGKKSDYDEAYNPDRLFPIPRGEKRTEIGIKSEHLPFYGFDLWNHYEVSWLNRKGKPLVAMAEISYDCRSPNIIESKSLKLYFNSFNNTRFSDPSMVESLIKKDLAQAIGSQVAVHMKPLTAEQTLSPFAGECLDGLDVECRHYHIEPSYLISDEQALVEETVYSDLLKSNCLVTHQPDWGSIQIQYKGPKIDREGLLKYIISFRNHNEFHEQCIERIFMDILKRCQPQKLTVYGRYTRRGGLDINPYRSTEKKFPEINQRLIRQ